MDAIEMGEVEQAWYGGMLQFLEKAVREFGIEHLEMDFDADEKHRCMDEARGLARKLAALVPEEKGGPKLLLQFLEKAVREFGIEHLEMDFDADEKHRCSCWYETAECGPAITYCASDDDGSMWAGNGEYETNVNFCPVCGKKAKKPAMEMPSDGLDENGEKVQSEHRGVGKALKREELEKE